jgi:drug/metabolite transporter (DMT)-like permease
MNTNDMQISAQEKKKRVLSWIMLSVLVVIWGSSFILIKRGVEVYSSMEVGAIRIMVAFLVLLPFALKRINRISRSKLIIITITGFIGTGMPAFLFAKAQTQIDSSLAGILNSLTPLFTLVLGLMFFRQKTRWVNVVGVLLGLIGAVGLIYSTSNGSFEFHFSFAIYAIIATMLYAIQSNMVKYYLNDVPSLTIASLGFFFIGFPATVLLFFFTDFPIIIVEHPQGLSAFFYVALLGFLASAIAIIIYNRLVQITNAVFATSVTYFVPILALFWGILDGEKFPFLAFLFAGVILIGVLLVNRRKKSAK